MKKWLNYQALWDIKMSTVFEQLGDDSGNWKKLITHMMLHVDKLSIFFLLLIRSINVSVSGYSLQSRLISFL